MNSFEMGVLYIPFAIAFIIFLNRYVIGFISKRASVISYKEWNPHVTIAVPCYNEGESIIETVKSLRGLDYPNFKIFIYDDCSTDIKTIKSLQRVKDEYPDVGVIFSKVNVGKRHILIQAVKDSNTELFMSVDSDCIIDPKALRNLVNRMTDDITAVGGIVRVSNPNVNILTRMQGVKYWIGYELLKGLETFYNQVMCLSGCITLYRREALLAVEDSLLKRNFLGNDIKYGEDRYLTRKLVEMGYSTTLTDDAFVYTKVPETFSNWFNQQLRWRRSNLVDFFGGIFTLYRLKPPVAIHYFLLGLLLFVYPLSIVHSMLASDPLLPIAIHILIGAVFSVYYDIKSRVDKTLTVDNSISFMIMPILFSVSYLMLTPLALFTLVTTNWETRK